MYLFTDSIKKKNKFFKKHITCKDFPHKNYVKKFESNLYEGVQFHVQMSNAGL